MSTSTPVAELVLGEALHANYQHQILRQGGVNFAIIDLDLEKRVKFLCRLAIRTIRLVEQAERSRRPLDESFEQSASVALHVYLLHDLRKEERSQITFEQVPEEYQTAYRFIIRVSIVGLRGAAMQK